VPLAPDAHESFVTRLAVKPLPPDLLRQALTHASYLNESDARAESNERLEFLGDALLGVCIADRLFRLYPDAPEGELTRMRADLVRGTTLAEVARRLELGDEMILGRGEEAAGGRSRDRNLAGTLEAVIGAVYLAHGMRAVRALVLRLLNPELRQIALKGARIDAKSSLQHLVQARWHEPPDYVTVDEGPGGAERRFVVEVRVAGTTLGRGEGASKRAAQQRAAGEAVARLSTEAEG
jgi:ribonuclease-3